jgi:type I restriction enzyme, S subunit
VKKLTNKAMGNFYPPDWKEHKFGDLFEFEGGMSLSRAQLSDKGICYLHYGDIHKSNDNYIDVEKNQEEIPKLNTSLEKIKDKHLLGDGDIVFADASEDYEGIGKSIVVINKSNIPFISGLHTIVARDKTNLLDNGYKKFFLSDWNIRKQIMILATGISVLGISKENLKAVRVFLPPIKEQKKIATILSTWDKGIELKEKLIEQKKEQKKGLMQKLLTGEVRLPGFNGEWKRTYLKNITVGKGTYGINAPSVEKSSELPTYLRITDISDEGYLIKSGLQSVDHPDVNNYFLEENDIVFARTGASTGRTYLYDKSDGKLVYAGFLIKFSIDTNKAVPQYIKFCTQTEEYHNWVRVMSMRSGQPGINAEEYSKLPLNLPPIEEQLEISEILTKVEREIFLLKKETELIRLQKKGLMQLLLTGKVRVKV